MLNAVKHLLFAMLLRPVQSANRSFTAFRMTNLLWQWQLEGKKLSSLHPFS